MNYLFATKIKLFLQDRHMCVNYTPTRKEALADFGVNGHQLDDYKAEIWQAYSAPIIRHSNHGEREVMLASYLCKNRTSTICPDKVRIRARTRLQLSRAAPAQSDRKLTERLLRLVAHGRVGVYRWILIS